MISINATLFIQIINFLILVFILKRLMYQPIMKLIDKRGKYIKDARSKIATMESETTELVDRCISLEKAALADARRENSQMRKDANTLAVQIIEETKDEIADIKAKISSETADQISNAKQFLRKEAVLLADAITEKFIGRRAGN